MQIELKRILISAQGPNKEPYKSEILDLFKSLNSYGGSLKNAQKVACFTEKPDSILAEKLDKLGVRIKIVENVDERSPHSNKIQMLSLDKSEDFDVLVALDSDIVVVNDFTKYIDQEKFSAKPVDQDPFSMENWKTIFDYFGLKIPQERHLTSFYKSETISYFNSGVLIIPQKYLSSIYDIWKDFVRKLLNSYDKMPEIKKNSFFTDQIALSLALASLKIPINPLPVEMNFPTNCKVHEYFKPEKITPYLIHYHHFSESGKIKNCTYENINKIIDKVNKNIIQENFSKNKPKNNFANPVGKFLKRFSLGNKKTQFDNQSFWDQRYQTNLELGSGIGSRGKLLEDKKKIIQDIIEKHNPKSVLDVGCGDLEVMKSFEIKNYTGIDISDIIISRNRQLKPDWNFFSGNFLDLAKKHQFEADFVICLDVLIHQHNYEEYFQFVKKLVESCNKISLIASFDEKPREEFSSKITAYHEPITKTLEKLNVKNYEILGNNRDVSTIFFKKQTSAAAENKFGANDIQEDKLKFALGATSEPKILLELVNLSRKNFGWFTKHLPRSYEYPWMINQVNEFHDKVFLDIGAGVTPLPIYLAEKGGKVFTVDPHTTIRKLKENPINWNEWGFLDYSSINKNIESINAGVEMADFPEKYFDCVYSVSVIEHVKTSTRNEIWNKVSKWIKPNGNLILTIDLYPDKELLWNFAEGKEVEDISVHGNLSMLKEEIQNYGFELIKCEFLRKIPESKVDCALISFKKIQLK